MSLIRQIALTSVVAAVAMLLFNPVGIAHASSPCRAGGANGRVGILIYGYCYVKSHASGPSHGSAPKTRTVSCGRRAPVDIGRWNPACGAPQTCVQVDPKTRQRTVVDAFGTETWVNGHWSKPVVWCPGLPLPVINVTALRQQAIRLLPAVQIGAAWSTTALVNAQTILWADTNTSRGLGTVTVLGQQVALRVSFRDASWDFGDGQRATAATPGKPYDQQHDPCRTPQCPHYFGHTYTQTGALTITLTVTWHAEFSLDGGASWTDIAGDITGPVTRHALDVKQARGILVPNPGDH